MATRKIPTTDSVVESLMTPSPREEALLALFEMADPTWEISYPDLLAECGKLHGLAAEEARRRGEPAVAHRLVKEALCFSAVAHLIVGIENRVERYRLQDIDEPGLVRLIELAGWLAPRAEAVEPIVEALRAVLPGIFAYIGESCPPPEGGPENDL